MKTTHYQTSSSLRFHNVIPYTLLICSLLLLGYYAYVTLTYGSISFAWTILIIGGFLLLWAGVEFYIKKHLYFFLPIIMRRTLLLFVIAGILLFTAVEGMLIYEGTHITEKSRQNDKVIVLGAQLKGNTITRSLRYRLDAALRYAKDHPDATFIVSGGKGAGESISEAQAMSDYLHSHGISKNQIIMEDTSTNTQENFRNSFALLNDDVDRITIITNSFHMKRARLICERMDKTCDGYPAKTDADLAPIFYFREFFAYMKDYVQLR